jgi:hypothetical protein
MRSYISLVALGLTILTACDRPHPTEPSSEKTSVPHSQSPLQLAAVRSAMDRLARRMARALEDPEFRAYVKGELNRSPFRESKLQLQRFLSQSNGRALHQLATTAGESVSSVLNDSRVASPLEIYFPVPAQRLAWRGTPDVLVASAQTDRDAPIAYDVRGKRHVLSATAPPAAPVLVIVPVETDFGPESSVGFAVNTNPYPTPLPPPPSPPAGLYMTYAHFVQDFEGWFKGEPEYEVHILGQAGTSDSLTDYQCAGAPAGGYYHFDQNGLDWSGSVLLFSQTQLNGYRTVHPNQNFRIIALEDDDTGCQIKFDANRFKNLQTTLQAAYPDLTGSKDTVGAIGRFVKRANALQKILRSAYSFITTQDDMIGNAVEDVVVGQFVPGANWIVKGENQVTNGWINLQMR